MQKLIDEQRLRGARCLHDIRRRLRRTKCGRQQQQQDGGEAAHQVPCLSKNVSAGEQIIDSSSRA
jgi:hypothetical protein